MEKDPPPLPPPPRLRDPPALPDELVEEILLRSPPDDPAHLVRAALVCKAWSRLVSARGFRRRFRDFHLQRRGAPMLGFLHTVPGANRVLSACFVRTAASCPPLDTQRGCLPLDARGGRVLLHLDDEHAGSGGADTDGIRLAVWDPLSAAAAAGGGFLELPVPILPQSTNSFNAALLLDHADGRFRVVLVGTHPERVFACVYSSLRPAAWSQPIHAAQHPHPDGAGDDYVDQARGALVRNAFYCLFQSRNRILKYDLATGGMSVIGLPPSHGGLLSTVLTTTEDGGLGFARVEGHKLCLWSMRPSPKGALAMRWARGRVIDLRSMLPAIDLLGFADGVGMILVGTTDGLFSVDKKSGQIDKLVDGPGFYGDIVPYVSLYTPALGKASTDEGPSGNA